MRVFFALRAVTPPQILSNPPLIPQGYTIDVDQFGSLGIDGVRGRYGPYILSTTEIPKDPSIIRGEMCLDPKYTFMNSAKPTASLYGLKD
jgi:hypothetical protein